jgi:hypothetical protein
MIVGREQGAWRLFLPLPLTPFRLSIACRPWHPGYVQDLSLPQSWAHYIIGFRSLAPATIRRASTTRPTLSPAGSLQSATCMAILGMHSRCFVWRTSYRRGTSSTGTSVQSHSLPHCRLTGKLSGDDTIKIYDWFDELRGQASTVGGHVLSHLGNHEWMNAIGDWRYAWCSSPLYAHVWSQLS